MMSLAFWQNKVTISFGDLMERRKMLLLERAKNRRTELDGKIKELRRRIKNLPAGRLECHRYENGYRWYVVKNGERKYLSKKEESLAERLAYKRKIYDEVEKIENEKIALDTFIKMSEFGQGDSGAKKAGKTWAGDAEISRRNSTKTVKVKDLLHYDYREHRENPEIDRLSEQYEAKINPIWAGWTTATYPRLSAYDDKKKVRSKSGHYFQSKDEAMIDDALIAHGLRIRYEPRLLIGSKYEYPDFYIWNPKTNKPIFWEHFGMFDDRTYFKRNILKLANYISHGYYPNVNFIATFMGAPFRIDEQYIETLIEYFFE